MQIALKETRLGLRNSHTRIPFRYGAAELTWCPQAVLRATIETDAGLVHGYSGDCLPPSWFDKSPDKDYPTQIGDMLAAIGAAEQIFASEFATATPFFPAWLVSLARTQAWADEQNLPPLLGQFGASMLERALLDALCRAARVSFADAIRSNLPAIDAGQVHPPLGQLAPSDWLPAKPLTRIAVRHTVGLGDPLAPADVPTEERLDDGYPQTLEEYVRRSGVRYFKIKVCNQLERDLDRLRAIAAIVEAARGDDYGVTLDGNEQYATLGEFARLTEAIGRDEKLAALWRNAIAIEQPLARAVALDKTKVQNIDEAAAGKPVIIDESDGRLESYRQALELGYRGVSSKNCKGAVKAILNAGLTWLRNDRGAKHDYLMTGEDLCSVGVAAVQADLCLAATLGLSHVERNGHHYHAGLSYLPAADRQAALAAHPDFYQQHAGRIAPRVEQGDFVIDSLHGPGFGFADVVNIDSWSPPQQWRPPV